jgi:hypothetical protein
MMARKASGDIDTPSIVSSRDENHPSNFMYGRRLHVQRLSPSIVYIVNRIFWRVHYTYRVGTVKNVEDAKVARFDPVYIIVELHL